MGIILAIRAVPEQQHQPGEPAGQADVAEEPLRGVSHLGDVEPDLSIRGTGRRQHTLDTHPGQRRRLDELAQRATDVRGQAREQDACQERKRCQDAECASQDARPGEAAAPLVDAQRYRSQHLAGQRTPAIRLAELGLDFLDDPVFGPNHDRAQGCEVRVGRPLVVDRDVEETRHAERLDIRCQLLEMAAKRLFALVQAKYRLEPRRLRPTTGRRACSAMASSVCAQNRRSYAR